MTSVWIIPGPELPIRQGDLLIKKSLKLGKAESICLVITADCDIHKNKFGNCLACLRVITLEEYITQHWAERKLEKATEKEVKKTLELVNKWNRRCEGRSELTEDALCRWISRAQPEEICSELQIPDGDLTKVLKCLKPFISAMNILNDNNLDSLRKLASFKSALNNTPIEKLWVTVLEQAKQDTFPDDIVFFPDLPQIETGPVVVLLREVLAVDHKFICYRAPDVTASEPFLRIGRLSPVYKYQLSQRFGSLYSKIGLPNEFEVKCSDAKNVILNIAWE